MSKSENSDSKNTLYCSFCGKSQHEVRKLIAGPNVFICNECVELCMDIIQEEDKSNLVSSGDKVPTPSEIKAHLDEYVIGQAQAKRVLEKSVHFMSWINFDLPPQELNVNYKRYYLQEDLAASTGAWSDANRHHRFRSWAATAALMQDYNRPITYQDYWYEGYKNWGEHGTTLLPGWSPQ